MPTAPPKVVVPVLFRVNVFEPSMVEAKVMPPSAVTATPVPKIALPFDVKLPAPTLIVALLRVAPVVPEVSVRSFPAEEYAPVRVIPPTPATDCNNVKLLPNAATPKLSMLILPVCKVLPIMKVPAVTAILRS